MLGVDRLDMIKGIPQKILAFEKFLEENPRWRDQVVLLQIAVPTRTDVPECMRLLIRGFICNEISRNKNGVYCYSLIFLKQEISFLCLNGRSEAYEPSS